jgi:hypothetical protein
MWCHLPMTGTYNCAALPNAGGTDVVIIASGYTVVVSSGVSFSFTTRACR